MFGSVLYRGNVPRQLVSFKLDLSIVRIPRTVRVFRGQAQRPLMQQTSSVPSIDVYAKTEATLQAAKALLLKV